MAIEFTFPFNHFNYFQWLTDQEKDVRIEEFTLGICSSEIISGKQEIGTLHPSFSGELFEEIQDNLTVRVLAEGPNDLHIELKISFEDMGGGRLQRMLSEEVMDCDFDVYRMIDDTQWLIESVTIEIKDVRVTLTLYKIIGRPDRTARFITDRDARKRFLLRFTPYL
jgi:hypothetical protein